MKITLKLLKKIIFENVGNRNEYSPPKFIYHVTTKPNTAKQMFVNGVHPQSTGSLAVGEDQPNKTYFTTNGIDAIMLYDDLLGDYNSKIEFSSWNSLDYPISILKIDTMKVPKATWYYDQESEGSPTDSIFTLDKIPSEAIYIVDMKTILNILRTKVWPSYGWSKQNIDKIPMPDDDEI